jgi:hypothetical protein
MQGPLKIGGWNSNTLRFACIINKMVFKHRSVISVFCFLVYLRKPVTAQSTRVKDSILMPLTAVSNDSSKIHYCFLYKNGSFITTIIQRSII